jgi:hypothetical protein
LEGDAGEVLGGLRRQRGMRRCSAGHGEVEGVVGVIFFFLEWRRVAAGTSLGGGELLLIGASMILWTNGQGKDMRMCARSRYGAGGQRGSAGYLGLVGIVGLL